MTEVKSFLIIHITALREIKLSQLTAVNNKTSSFTTLGKQIFQFQYSAIKKIQDFDMKRLTPRETLSLVTLKNNKHSPLYPD